MSFKIGSVETNYQPNFDKGSSHNHIYLGDSAIPKSPDTAVQKAFDTAGKVIESTGDLLTAPGRWLKDMQQNWFGYMILLAIILSAVTFLYCMLRLYCYRNRNKLSTTNLIELATTLAKTNSPGQRPSSLAGSDLAII
jgi:hypothetical protein